MNTKTTASLADTSLLINLSISTWDAVVLDRAVSEAVEARAGAAQGVFRGRKSLLPANANGQPVLPRRGGVARADSLQALHTLAAEVRAYHYRSTVLWETEGTSLLHAKRFAAYFDFMGTAKVRHDAALDTFCAEYPALIDAARPVMRDLFDPTLYPSVDEVRSRFAFTLRTSPVPSYALREQLQVQLGDAVVQQLQAEAAERERAVAATAMRQVWARLAEPLKAMADSLADPTKVFRDSLIDNVREAVAMLPEFNFTDDPELHAMGDAILAILKPPAALRVMPEVRRETATAAAAAVRKIDAMLEAF